MRPLQAEWMGWASDNPWAVWAVAALLLGGAEMLTTDLSLLMLAIGALAGVGVAVFWPHVVWLQMVIAIGVAAAMLGFVRPSILRRIAPARGYTSSLTRLVGSDALVLERVTEHDGLVKVNGEQWSARTLPGADPIDAGLTAEVYEVDGATLVVYRLVTGEITSA